MPKPLPDTAAAAPSNASIVDSWVKDGTPAAEPVTTETPADGAGGPAAEAAPPAATEPEKPAAPPVETPDAAPAAIEDFIEAQLGDGSVFKVPRSLRLPSKRGEQTIFEPLETVLGERMMERDYRIKTAEAGAARRQLAVDRARLEERERFVKEQEQVVIDAQKDPEKWETFQAHLEQLRTNPIYRKHFEDAQAKRETEAELAVHREREAQAVIHDGVAQAVAWIDQLAKEPGFEGVDPERVRVRYGELLSAGHARLDPADVRQLFRAEADYLQRSVSPLQAKLDALSAEIQGLKSGKAAEAHNATTAHAVSRAKAPPVATGTPPALAAPGPKGRFGPRDLADRNAEWARQR